MIDYFKIKLIANNKEYYSIWYSDESDAFITESKRIKTFEGIENLERYAELNTLKLSVDNTEMEFDTAINWLGEIDKNIDCTYLLDFWNIISDISNSVGDNFIGNTDKEIINQIYNKLFYGNNIPAIKGDEKDFIPKWTIQEKNELNKVVSDGIRILEIYLLT